MFVGSEDAKVIIQGIAITGITDISFSSNVEEKAVVLLADRGINRKVNNGHTVQCKISKSYLGKDRLQEFTGITNLSGQFIYGTNALEFDQATISSYSISADAESSPKVSVDIKIFGDFKKADHNTIIEFEKGHFRRIIDPKVFKKKFTSKTKSKIIYQKSGINLSIVKNDNPNLSRIVFKFE